MAQSTVEYQFRQNGLACLADNDLLYPYALIAAYAHSRGDAWKLKELLPDNCQIPASLKQNLVRAVEGINDTGEYPDGTRKISDDRARFLLAEACGDHNLCPWYAEQLSSNRANAYFSWTNREGLEVWTTTGTAMDNHFVADVKGIRMSVTVRRSSHLDTTDIAGDVFIDLTISASRVGLSWMLSMLKWVRPYPRPFPEHYAPKPVGISVKTNSSWLDPLLDADKHSVFPGSTKSVLMLRNISSRAPFLDAVQGQLAAAGIHVDRILWLGPKEERIQ